MVERSSSGMTMQVGWTQPATAHLQDLHQYISQSSFDSADRQVKIVLAAVIGLQDFPQRGRPGRRKGTQELVVTGTPYIVAYRIRQTVIEILAVIHSARRWPRRLGE